MPTQIYRLPEPLGTIKKNHKMNRLLPIILALLFFSCNTIENKKTSQKLPIEYDSIQKNPDFIKLLQENYDQNKIKNYINHINSLKLDRLLFRIWWLLGRTIKLVLAVYYTKIHWRRLKNT